MLVLGIILLLVAAALLVAALFGGRGIDQPAGIDLGAVKIDLSTFSVFLVGAVTVALVVAGLALISAGLRRARRRRQEKKELHRLTRKVEAQESRTAVEPTGTTATTSDTATTGETATGTGTGTTTGETATTEPTAVDETTGRNVKDPDHRNR